MKKPPSNTNSRSQVIQTQKAAAKRLGVSARTLRNWRAEGCPGFGSDGTVDLAQVMPWAEKRLVGREGAADSKEEKLREEIRKLRLANDAREGRLVERAWVGERVQRAAGELNAFRAKSEAEHPTKFAATTGDVAMCRSIVRGIWDEIFRELELLAKHFDEVESTTVGVIRR